MPSRYPHPELPEGVEWRSTDLYSIAGWMDSWYGLKAEKRGTAFGGYFRLDLLTGHIEGEIVDVWGAAFIKGSLQDDVLQFEKSYHSRSHWQSASKPINYRFSRVGGGWQGAFELIQNGTRGNAECKIQLVVENAFNLAMGPLRERDQ